MRPYINYEEYNKMDIKDLYIHMHSFSSYEERITILESILLDAYKQGLDNANFNAFNKSKEKGKILELARKSFVSGDTAISVKYILDYLQGKT